MLEKIRHIIGRFPDKEDEVRQLWQTNAAFESLAHRHFDVSDRLQRLTEQGGEPGREAEELRQRQIALEDQMLTIMEQSSRV